MQHAMLLDCTLRDGAYLIDKKFGENNIRGIVDGLVKSRIDCIEIGFFQDDGFGEGKTVYLNSADAKKYIPENKNGAMFTVLADYSRYSIDNLDECDGTSIDAVRECFFKAERFDAIKNCKIIKEKGYKCFVQPVDIMGYSDIELIEFLQLVNEVEPYCLSIVDTFGSMYQEDLHRVFEIINHNLTPTCRIGFHSHNNMQMSNALSQEFLRMTFGKREVIVDGTIAGMGRGAGNTPTELIAQYMVNKLNYSYDIDALLDIIDNYMDNIRTKCSWGYSTPYFIAGCYGAHVNNVTYLTKKNSIKSKDIRYILNKIGAIPRKRYDYDLLEKTYLEYLMSNIDDSSTMNLLNDCLKGRNVMIIAPGASTSEYSKIITEVIESKNSIIISVNGVALPIQTDFVYMNNTRRFAAWNNNSNRNQRQKLIITSNLECEKKENIYVVSFLRLIKCGWEHIDNSVLMLLRLLDCLDVESIDIAGFDGYSYANNYASKELALANINENPSELNLEIQEMLNDYMRTRRRKNSIAIITPSKFVIKDVK